MRIGLHKKVLVIAWLALLMSACGGGDGESTTTLPAGSTTTTDGVESTTTVTDDPGQGEAPELTGDYLVTHYYSPEYNGATNLWPDTEITLSIGADGSISGNGGCNEYTGTYEVSGPYITEPGFDEEDGQAMSISNLSFTERACDDELTMEQEAEFFAALQNVDQWWVGQGFGEDGNALLLLSLEDGLQVQASRDG